MCFAFPDTCLVPAAPSPIPTPFPNIAQCATALAPTCALRVKVMNMPMLHKGSVFPMTQGDEAGTGGGVVSGMFMGQAVYRAGVSTVKIEGNDAVTAMMATAHNGASANAPAGSQIAPSQAKVIVGP